MSAPRHAADAPTPRLASWLTPEVRRWVYGIALAALPLATAYGLVTEAHAPLWASLVGSILVPGLALAHTPTGGSA
ncbi:hypothetical protein [Schaalia hyovaginalis]|uniref:hypothetical protein n=1 Tax=Schaalia TaxID=2529408 RepID=UPI0026ED8551|nr:hypothetical protein [Schaalia hyovaginalis]MCI6557949.1 hypothetical protein [Schaalia hyovaginalis]MDD7554536.1 hypothetical protein [Schaalia hyovaginalis]MDY3094389.1 hypothetical protein [Schaalia hyovaginalis]MDY3665550.1 hypothetical protein [Schaalia hyovaginalis]